MKSIRLARETEAQPLKFDSKSGQGWKQVLEFDAKRYSLIFTLSSDTGGAWALSKTVPTSSPIAASSYQETAHLTLLEDGEIITYPLWIYDAGGGGKTDINIMTTRLARQ